MSSQQASQGCSVGDKIGGYDGAGIVANGWPRSADDSLDDESTSQDGVPILLRRIDEINRLVAARDLELQSMLGGVTGMSNSSGGELAALIEDIRSAIHKRHSLRAEARDHESSIQRLAESLERANRRVTDLDEKVVRRRDEADQLPKTNDESCTDVVRTSENANENGDDGGIWRDTISSLEGELRRKSIRALELRRRVHWLETQLGQQLEVNEQRTTVARAALEDVLARMDGRNQAPGNHIPPVFTAANPGNPVLLHTPVR